MNMDGERRRRRRCGFEEDGRCCVKGRRIARGRNCIKTWKGIHTDDENKVRVPSTKVRVRDCIK